jgi:hypothetical protein
MDLQARLVAYSGNDFVGILPTPTSLNWGAPLNDTPQLQFSYSTLKNVPGADLVKQLNEQQYDVAVELNWGEGWQEPRSARFILPDLKNDPADVQRLWNFIGVGVDDDLRGVIVTDSSVYNAEGKRVFTNATPGQLLATYHNYGASRGMLSYLTYDFTPTMTSNHGNPGAWGSAISIDMPKETNYATVRDALVSYGLINWCTEGNVFRAFNTGSDGSATNQDAMEHDHTGDDAPVILMLGRECLDGPQQFSRRNLATDVWVLGDDNAAWLRTKTDTFIRRGRRVIAVSQTGANEGLAAIIGDRNLEVAATQREQLTRTLNFDTARVLPWRNYRPGDWVLAPGKDNGHVERLRVAQITLVFSAGAVTSGSIVLNDRLLERAILQQKQLDGLAAGATISGGTGGGTRPVPPSEKRKPAKPAGNPTVVGSAYVDKTGHVRAVIQIQWPGVSNDTGGQAITIDHYNVRVRRTA